LERRKKDRLRRLTRWLLIDLTVAVVVFGLLFHRPSRYSAYGLGPGDPNREQAHRYVPYLSSEIYNGAQSGEPFALVVIDKGLNESITPWSAESEGIRLTSPEILFEPDRIVLMGTADVRGAEFIVTIALKPVIDEKGLLNVAVTAVRIGAMNITPLAKIIARHMYGEWLETMPIDTRDWRAKLAASLINDEPFDPVFRIDGRKVRVENITVAQGKLVLAFVPSL
jgi:hypothetical protein